MRQLLLLPLTALLLASCSIVQPRPSAPKSNAAWQEILKDLELPLSRTEVARKLPKSVPLKKGEALAAFYFVHSSNPRNYEFYPLNDESLLMLQVGYKTEPITPESTGDTESVMDGVKQLQTSPTKDDLIVSSQIVLRSEIRFLGINKLPSEATTAASVSKKP